MRKEAQNVHETDLLRLGKFEIQNLKNGKRDTPLNPFLVLLGGLLGNARQSWSLENEKKSKYLSENSALDFFRIFRIPQIETVFFSKKVFLKKWLYFFLTFC